MLKRTKRFFILLIIIFLVFGVFTLCPTKFTVVNAMAMPFYDLKPKKMTLRSEFYTSFPNSSEERKSNIQLCAKILDNTLVDVNGEFSFNKTVGARTERRGFKMAKIIVNGEFVDGVGGGVCQVSTTLYNALLLSGLKITEFHPHSLQVSYVAPSFDAMVNSGSADLRFINNTHNPIIIKASATDQRITISIYGEPTNVKYLRKSVIKEEVPSPVEIIEDDGKLYPELSFGEEKIISYGKRGLKSQAILVKVINGKEISAKVIRNDKYGATKTIIIKGIKEQTEQENSQ